jgi:serine/threonine-protein kinase
MHLSEGSSFGNYRNLSLLGKGGMGEVYLAEDTKLGRKVALKLLPAVFVQEENRLRRFIQEAKTASALNHPNIVTIYEIGEQAGTHFLAMEHIDGQTLRDRLRAGRLALSEVLEIATQATSALSAAHAASIIHRDIKPENIMIRRDGYLKILDFGLAKLVEQDQGDDATATMGIATTMPGMVMGTAQYMSPEQARGRPVDARSDLFSLGIVLYELATGRPPFEGETVNHRIIAILEREPPPLAAFVPDAPPELERILLKALTKDVDERYQTAKDLAVDIKKLRQRLALDSEMNRVSGSAGIAVESGSSRAMAAVPTTPVAAVVDRPAQKRVSPLWWGALAVLLAGGGFGAIQWLRPKPAEPLPVPAALPATAPVEPAAVTAADVFNLLQNRVAEAVIMAKIRAWSKPILLSADEVLKFKAAGASDQLIMVMFDPASPPPPVAQPANPVPAPPATVTPSPPQLTTARAKKQSEPAPAPLAQGHIPIPPPPPPAMLSVPAVTAPTVTAPARIAEPELPAAPGIYLFADSRWTLLPAAVTQAQVVKSRRLLIGRKTTVQVSLAGSGAKFRLSSNRPRFFARFTAPQATPLQVVRLTVDPETGAREMEEPQKARVAAQVLPAGPPNAFFLTPSAALVMGEYAVVSPAADPKNTKYWDFAVVPRN